MVSRTETLDPRVADAHPHRPNYKRIIEQFFRPKSFSPKAVKKLPKEQPGPVLRLCELNALVEAVRRRVDDQKREHKRILQTRKHHSSK